LTSWGFSLTQDLCVTAMINRSTVSINKKLFEVSNTLFKYAEKTGTAV